jgi:Ca-activated chloride channel family protein
MKVSAFTSRVGAVAAIGAALTAAPDFRLGAASQQDPPLFSARADLVLLHVTVTDRQGRYISGLSQQSFRVFEDNKPQEVRFFLPEDAPATVGFLVDNSGSMQANRLGVLTAAQAFVAASNPDDELFALTFNDDIRAVLPADSPFTSDHRTLHLALGQAIRPQGRTALHSAIAAGLEYLDRGRHERKALVIVSDGADNASAMRFEQLLAHVEASNVLLYTLGLIDPLESDANPKRLRALAAATGGLSFFPEKAPEVRAALERAAEDLRHGYLLAYELADTSTSNALRRIRVAVELPGRQRTVVRTRTGYRMTPPGEANHGR